MRAKEFTTEAEGTFYHGTRSDFDFDQLGSGKGLITFDRILGPHFSRTPEIASRFALYDPQSTERQTKMLSGARVFPVHIPGDVYQLPQPRGMTDMAAVASDAFTKIILPNKELLEQYLDIIAVFEYKRQQELSQMVGNIQFDPSPNEAVQRIREYYQHNLKYKKYWVVAAPMFKIGFTDESFLKHIAEEYKQLLLGQGYGVIEYRNTNPKETRGIADKNSYIALTKPKSIFNKQGELDEGWRDWVMGAGMGAIALGGGLAGYDAAHQQQQQPAPIVQPTPEPVQPYTKELNPLERVLIKVAQESGIKGTELNQLVAQCAHETMNFSTLEEMGTDKYITRKYDKRFNPQKAKILGNIKPGDGLTYKGRGYIQLTGRYNYKKAGEALGLPLEQQPELVERPDIAAKVAVWFWQQRVKPKVQDFTSVKQSTKPINPKMAGLKQRQAQYDKYAAVSNMPVRKKS